MKLAGIIINYRTAAMTADAVPGLLQELERAGESHLFIVDNDSQDGSVEYFEQRAREANWGARVSIIAAGFNGGYGYGINMGVKAGLALPRPPEYFYIINSDASADPGSLRTMVDFLDEHPSVGVAGSRVNAPDGQAQGAAFRFLGVLSELESQAELGLISALLRRWAVARELPATSCGVDWIPGTSMLIRRTTFETVGLFDEQFFLYFEEIDYCLRVRRAGIDIYFVHGAPITHLGSVSTGLEDTGKRYPMYWYESRHRYFLKHHGLAYAAACDAAFLAGTALRRAKRALKPGPAERPHALRDFVSASLLHLTSPRKLLANGGPPVTDTRRARELQLVELLLEDVNTYDWGLLEPGLWAVAAHRLASAAERASTPLARSALHGAHSLLADGVDLAWGIRIPARVQLGRRVRLWNNGCMLLDARSIGDDVSISEDTTFGPLTGMDADPDQLPVLGDRVKIGSGVSVLGSVTVGSDVVIQPNSVVLKHAPAGSTLIGVPAEPMK